LDTVNLCMFAPEFFPVWGGTGSYIIELVKFLPKDVNIQLITLKRQISGMTDTKLTEQSINSIIKRPISIHYIATSRETFFYNIPFQIACFRHIQSLQKKYSFDILHTQMAHMPDLFVQLSGKNKVPTVVTIHSTIQMLRDYALLARSLFGTLESSEKNALIFSPILQLLQHYYSKHMSNFIAVSEMTRKFTIDHMNADPKKVSLVYNGVDSNVFHPPEKEELEKKYSSPTVVYIGRIVAKKGIHVLIKAMPEILRRFPKVRFLFVGGGNVSVYRHMAREMGISDFNFCFLGHLGYYERLKILREATVFVNPSFFENCSISILEAMSSECAVVACNVGGNPEILKSGSNGLLVPFLDSKSLAGSIISLLADESLNKRMSREARKTVEKSFSAERCAQETFNVYRKVMYQNR
jgi:glycosyltransferase involved in cell wall biosynthesis